MARTTYQKRWRKGVCAQCLAAHVVFQATTWLKCGCGMNVTLKLMKGSLAGPTKGPAR